MNNVTQAHRSEAFFRTVLTLSLLAAVAVIALTLGGGLVASF